MNFKRDILLIDTEFTGFDLEKNELLQIAGVLLDKKTLKEKKHFNTFIRQSPALWKHRNRASMKVNKISLEQLKDAPSLKEAIKKFDKTFGHNVLLAAYVGYNDKRFLLDAYKRAGMKFKFDYHYFDLWGLFYAFLAVKNQLKSKKDFAGFGLEYLMKYFSAKGGSASGEKIFKAQQHDALVDCRMEAEVLRRVIKQMK